MRKRRSKPAESDRTPSSHPSAGTPHEHAARREALRRAVIATISTHDAHAALRDPRFLEWLLEQPSIAEPLENDMVVSDAEWLARGQELREAARKWMATAAAKPEK